MSSGWRSKGATRSSRPSTGRTRLSQFAVVTAVLLWIYLGRNEAYLRLRNTLIVVNTLGLVGYAALPTAPPRLIPERGFVGTLADSGVRNDGSALIELVSNPYAAMPSLHAADAR